MDLDLCNQAKAALEPRLGGVQNGGFGNEWAVGCFFNGGTVYFGTTGAATAHTDPQSYRTNGGWRCVLHHSSTSFVSWAFSDEKCYSDRHKALCEWSGGEVTVPVP